MEQLYINLDEKFKNILSGTCLTSIRDENSRICRKYDRFDESRLSEMREDFLLYLSNCLFLKGYDKVEANLENSAISAVKGNVENDFLLDFDFGGNDGTFSIKVLDKGIKCGLSVSEAKYLLLVSVEKGLLALINSEKLKTSVREKNAGYKLITENDSLFKTQYINISQDKLTDKTRLFSLK